MAELPSKFDGDADGDVVTGQYTRVCSFCYITLYINLRDDRLDGCPHRLCICLETKRGIPVR